MQVDDGPLFMPCRVLAGKRGRIHASGPPAMKPIAPSSGYVLTSSKGTIVLKIMVVVARLQREAAVKLATLAFHKRQQRLVEKQRPKEVSTTTSPVCLQSLVCTVLG